jgi:uncharacterized protein VirK/YbjX
MIIMAEHVICNPPPVSAWRLFVSLVTGEWQPSEIWGKASYRRKFLWRGLLAPVSTRQLLEILVRCPDMQRLLTCQPRMPLRLHRPYLTLKFTRKQKLIALQCHYNAMNRLLTSRQRASWLSHSGLHLGTLLGKDNVPFFITLKSEVNFDKEGECTMVLHDEQGRVLAKITFTLCWYQGKTTLLIGGLQGASRLTPHEAIRQATKACYGLFPKRIVLDAVCYFAQHLQAEQMLAVGNEAHVYRGARYWMQASMVYADYDIFWESMGARHYRDGLYILPLAPLRKDISTIPSKKRAEYHRRFALLDTLAQQIQTVLA